MRTHKKPETLQRTILPQEETIRGLRFKAQSPAAENERLRAGTAVMNRTPPAIPTRIYPTRQGTCTRPSQSCAAPPATCPCKTA